MYTLNLIHIHLDMCVLSKWAKVYGDVYDYCNAAYHLYMFIAFYFDGGVVCDFQFEKQKNPNQLNNNEIKTDFHRLFHLIYRFKWFVWL